MIHALCRSVAIALAIGVALTLPARAQEAEPEHVRGQITAVKASSLVVKTRDGKTVHLGLTDDVTIIGLTKCSFTDVDFGTYVGSVSIRLDAYSPIVRDSLSWLHRGYELRVIDDSLRGIALGHRKWDLTEQSVMTHGWVDDLEIRVLSIKFGPTEAEETDVDIPRDVPILNMSLGDRSLLKRGAQIFAGVDKGEGEGYVAVFLLVGKDGVVPSL